MRRKRASAGCSVHTRSGVTASVRHRKRSTQSPVPRISASAGFGPSVFGDRAVQVPGEGQQRDGEEQRLGGGMQEG